MSANTNTSVLVLLFISLTAFATPQTESFPFYQGSWTEFKSIAKELKKPYFIYFHDKSKESITSDSNWIDDELNFYVDRYYLAFQQDISKQMHEFVEKYELTSWPSFVFFDSEGQLMGLREGGLSAKELLSLLQTFFFQLEDPLRIVYSSRKKDREELINPSNSNFEDVEEKIGFSRSTTKVQRANDFSTYNLTKLPEEQKNGHSIQISTYEKESELITALNKYKRLWKSHIWIYKENKHERIIYHLLLGLYKTEQEAGYFRDGIAQLTGKKIKILPLAILLK